MVIHQTLDIAGYQGEAVPNELLRQEAATDHLAILLPGMGYTCDMPLFYYLESLLLNRGADVLSVRYRYGRNADYRQRSDAEQLTWLQTDADAAVRLATSQRDYRWLSLVGKSLGTLAMAHLLRQDLTPPLSAAIWLTPVLRDESVPARIKQYAHVSFMAIGSADHFFDLVTVNAIKHAGCDTLVVAEANHSFDVGDDIAASIDALRQVVLAAQHALTDIGNGINSE